MIQVSKSFKLFSSSLIRRPRLDCISLYNVSDEGIFVDSYPAIKLLLNTETSEFCPLKEAREGFRCCSVCETIEDYKEGHLMVWTNYMSPCSSIVGLYFKGTCDVISVTMATHNVHKSVL